MPKCWTNRDDDTCIELCIYPGPKRNRSVYLKTRNNIIRGEIFMFIFVYFNMTLKNLFNNILKFLKCKLSQGKIYFFKKQIVNIFHFFLFFGKEAGGFWWNTC